MKSIKPVFTEAMTDIKDVNETIKKGTCRLLKSVHPKLLHLVPIKGHENQN